MFIHRIILNCLLIFYLSGRCQGIGWAVGKLSAVRAGEEATRAFAQLNTIPLFLWLLTNFKTGAALTTSIIPSLLFAAYVYAGFVEEP